jgi:hypothetical protein
MTPIGWRRRLTLAIGVVLAVSGAIVLGAAPAQAVRVGLFVLVAVGVEIAARLVGAGAENGAGRQSPFAAIARPPRSSSPPPPEHRERRRRDVWLATESIAGWHFRLRPVMREISDGLLEDRHGVGLDQDPERARELLGPAAWERLRADLPAPDDRWAAGLTPDELASMVTRIEEL